jgi:hypothetical protein
LLLGVMGLVCGLGLGPFVVWMIIFCWMMRDEA